MPICETEMTINAMARNLAKYRQTIVDLSKPVQVSAASYLHTQGAATVQRFLIVGRKSVKCVTLSTDGIRSDQMALMLLNQKAREHGV